MPAPSTFSRILVGTDLSDAARAAFEQSLELACAHEAELLIVHARTSSPGEDTVEEGISELTTEARNRGVSVRSEIRDGASWRVLANTATEESADLIVVGARGHTIVMSLLLGHTADRLLRVALTPVMCVHADDTPRTTRRRTVLAATDLSAEGNAAIGLAARVLAPFGSDGRLVVVNVESTPPFYESEPPATAGAHEVPDITAKALERLDELVAPHRESGLEVVTAAVPGYAPSAIEEQAAEYEADWIVMGSRGESALEAMLIGSVAERVLHHSARPVLLVPEDR